MPRASLPLLLLSLLLLALVAIPGREQKAVSQEKERWSAVETSTK